MINGLSTVVNIDAHQLSMSSLLGYRPVTEDTYPIVGSLGENTWCIYGTKRDGFTWSNYFAENISRELLDGYNSEPSWQALLK